jgi:protocatechuate 3,4-dioxygenase alpha subunit
VNATSHQTIGPFWHLIADSADADLLRFGAGGTRIVLEGTVTDGDKKPVTDACIEIAQSSPRRSDRFFGWGRCATDAEGWFRFQTIAPDPKDGSAAPRVDIIVHARGLLKPLYTCAYFEGDPRNAGDPLLAAIVDPARQRTLIARSTGELRFRFDVRLQGEDETVFLDL